MEESGKTPLSSSFFRMSGRNLFLPEETQPWTANECFGNSTLFIRMDQPEPYDHVTLPMASGTWALVWNDFYNSSSPGEAWELFEAKIRSVLNQMCPIKTIRINKVTENWITNEILEQIHDKDYFLRKAKERDNEDDLEHSS